MNTAMSAYGRSTKNAQSIRQSAPDRRANAAAAAREAVVFVEAPVKPDVPLPVVVEITDVAAMAHITLALPGEMSVDNEAALKKAEAARRRRQALLAARRRGDQGR